MILCFDLHLIELQQILDVVNKKYFFIWLYLLFDYNSITVNKKGDFKMRDGTFKATKEDILRYTSEEELKKLDESKGIIFLDSSEYSSVYNIYTLFLEEIEKLNIKLAHDESNPVFDRISIIFNTYVRDNMIRKNQTFHNNGRILNNMHYLVYIHEFLPKYLNSLFRDFFVDPTNELLYSNIDEGGIDYIIHAENEKTRFLEKEDFSYYLENLNYPTHSGRFMLNARKIALVYNYFIFKNSIHTDLW